jgi:hypothetical protein
MQLSIEVNDSMYEHLLFILKNMKDVKIIENDIEIIDKNDKDYEILLEGRKDRILNPQNYISEKEIDWEI